MIQYILQVAAFQLVFLMVYDAFLKKETFFNWNRVYLLCTALISIIIPFIKLEAFKNSIPEQYIINLPEVFIGNSTPVNQIQLETVIIESKPFWTWETLFYLGIILATLLFVFKIVRVIWMWVKNPKIKLGNLFIVNLLNSNSAFSFFHYIFLGERLADSERKAILKHEMVHVNQKHTIDLLFFEVMRILFWFNPLVYMYQNRIMTLHEFIADQEAVKHQDKNHYYQNLLSQVFQTQKISFINPFFKQSLIKKRIIMLQKSKSKQIKLLKYALLIPMILGMLVYTSCASHKKQMEEKEYSLVEQINQLKQTIEGKKETPKEEEKQAMIDLSKVLDKTKYANSTDVPFAYLDKSPVFPGCEDVPSNTLKGCFSVKITDYIVKNFNTDIAKENGLKGKQRINVIFKIDTNGSIIDIRSRAPYPALEIETMRVIKTIPELIPGEYGGKKVNVLYSLPIVFQVDEEKSND